eukprot:13871112-Alexandrium_andersonii.AAC.1
MTRGAELGSFGSTTRRGTALITRSGILASEAPGLGTPHCDATNCDPHIGRLARIPGAQAVPDTYGYK